MSGKLYLEDGHHCVLMLKHGWWKGFCVAADLLDEAVPVSALVWENGRNEEALMVVVVVVGCGGLQEAE